MFFVKQNEIPQDRQQDVMYARIVCNYRDEKKEKERTRLCMGGDITTCPFDYGTPTAELLTIKLLLNSVISTPMAEAVRISTVGVPQSRGQ